MAALLVVLQGKPGAAGSAGSAVVAPTAPASCTVPSAGAERAWLGGVGALATLLAGVFARRRRAGA